jgi:hypothetical protein
MGKNRTTLRWDRQKATVVAYLTSGPEAMGGERESIPHQRLCFLGVDHPKNQDGFLQVTLNYLMAFNPFLLPKKNESLVEG